MNASRESPTTLCFRAMGSPCELLLDGLPAQRGMEISVLAQAETERLEALYSRYRTSSLLSEINRVAAHGGHIEVDTETASLLDYAATCHRESNGLFDITSGVLRRAWKFSKDAALRPPTAQQLEPLLELTGWHKLRWERPRLKFEVPGMEIDFGGIVKEYAADRVAALCREAGAAHGLVNLGGDIRVIGARRNGEPWRIGIQHPETPGVLLHTLELHRGGLTTSGDYERCMVVDGVRYGHILNPRTGWPVRYLSSVTVAAEFCLVAGSASTIAMLKEDSGPEWLTSLGLPHLWVMTGGACGGTLAPRPDAQRGVT